MLRTLAQRVDRPPDQGFTQDTLLARAELLRSSADLLTDPQRRAHYESELTALSASGDSLQAALDMPASKEVAGLLLLLEAGMPLECFELASRALQPPQAPALGSGREADLSLLAALACLDAAADLRQERRYEAAAQVLGQGNQLLQRMGQHGDLRQRMATERRTLRPYRVLDLLSRDLGASRERSEGLALLQELVEERGGLDGQRDPDLSPEEFQAFFSQIRAYLTVQEQIDLFERWAPQSASADFLAATALTALGFAQRKPERIAAARSRLLARGKPELKPLLACLNLLLGQVDSAEFLFADGASEELREWAARQSDDPLAQVCAYCRDWLARDVLPGYRDLEADADLEAYFADRDVQAYLDSLEPAAQAAGPGGAQGGLGASLRSPFALAGAALPGAQALLGFGPLGDEHGHDLASGEAADDTDEPETERAPLARRWRTPALLVAGALATVLVALGLVSLLRPRPAAGGVEPAAEGAGAAKGNPEAGPEDPAASAAGTPTEANAAG
ncbi:MAG: molecular chaperone DnaJ, partial [Synechococcaceae cyanobacterium]